MTAYNKDLVAWSDEQAAALRAGNWSALDIENISEEIAALGRNDARATRSHLAQLLMHLLKWEFQPGLRSNSWRVTITVQRDDIADLLDESPSLRGRLPEFMDKAWPRARKDAMLETGLPAAAFPIDCPYSIEQALDEAFFPGEK